MSEIERLKKMQDDLWAEYDATQDLFRQDQLTGELFAIERQIRQLQKAAKGN